MNTPIQSIDLSDLEIGESLVLNDPETGETSIVQVFAVVPVGEHYYRVDHAGGTTFYPAAWPVKILSLEVIVTDEVKVTRS